MKQASCLKLAAALPLLILPARAADEKWAVPSAEVRFKVEIAEKPSDPEAGIVAIFQNGGLLPQSAPDSVVLDSTGKELKSECIWDNPNEGYAIVFETPTAPGEIAIYLKPAIRVRAWTPQSPLHPGLLLYTEVGKTNLREAQAIATQAPPGRTGRMGLVPMVADRANRYGSSENYASYYCGWLKVPENGPIGYATISSDGSQAILDGKVVADWPGKHPYQGGMKGDKGKTMDIGKGPRRFEYFHFSVSENPQAQFAWRLPDAPKEYYATPANNDWVRSGSVKLLSAESRSGVPLAIFEKNATSYLGFDSNWIDLFTLRVPMAEDYPDAEFSWNIEGKYKLSGSTVLWPVVRGDLPKATLTIKTSRGSTSSSRILYPDVIPHGANIAKKEHRKMWQEAMLNRVKAGPHRNHAADDWPKPFWTLLPEIIEPGEAQDLLSELFNNSANEVRNLPQEALNKLEDIYFDEIIIGGKKEAEAFLKKAINDQKDPALRFHWQIKQIDYYLFEAGDTKTARQLAEKLDASMGHGMQVDSVLRLVQCGDIERTEGNLDRAMQWYAAAQRASRQPLSNQQDHPMGAATPTPTPVAKGMVIGASTGSQTDWRVRTVRQNAYFSQVKSLLDQKNYLQEAKAALEQWQVEFPFSKLNGDYALAEGRYYYQAGNLERAVRVLRAYRKQTEISNELPPVMELELNCIFELQRAGELKELVDDIKKRFPDLPLVEVAENALEGKAPSQAQTIRR
ncbi:MAG: hypothetical protein WCH57_01120 [Verrucomicrobiota bacterium]